MKIGTHGGGFKRYPLEKVFEIASRTGFDGVEVVAERPHFYPEDVDAAAIDNLFKLREKYNIEVPVYCLNVLDSQYLIPGRNPAQILETRDFVKKALHIASDAEIPMLLLNCGHAGYGTNRRENQKLIKKELLYMLDEADKVGVDVIIEPISIYESNTYYLLDDIVELLEDLNHPRAVTMLDTATPFCHWEPYADYFEKMGDKLRYVHFVDADGVSEAHLRLGTGKLPLVEVLRIFKRFNYDGWCTIEILSGYKRDAEMYAGHDLKVMKALLKEAGY